MSSSTKATTPPASSLVTAAQINDSCPAVIDDLGKKIAVHLQKVRTYEAKAHKKAGVELRKADDNWNTVTQLLAEAKAKCDGGGFKAFKARYCPDLSKSYIYELIAIGSGKKTAEESLANKRGRVARSRAKRQAKVSATGDVADTPGTGNASQLNGNAGEKPQPAEPERPAGGPALGNGGADPEDTANEPKKWPGAHETDAERELAPNHEKAGEAPAPEKADDDANEGNEPGACSTPGLEQPASPGLEQPASPGPPKDELKDDTSAGQPGNAEATAPDDLLVEFDRHICWLAQVIEDNEDNGPGRFVKTLVSIRSLQRVSHFLAKIIPAPDLPIPPLAAS
jgi:hypothetical protein